MPALSDQPSRLAFGCLGAVCPWDLGQGSVTSLGVFDVLRRCSYLVALCLVPSCEGLAGEVGLASERGEPFITGAFRGLAAQGSDSVSGTRGRCTDRLDSVVWLEGRALSGPHVQAVVGARCCWEDAWKAFPLNCWWQTFLLVNYLIIVLIFLTVVSFLSLIFISISCLFFVQQQDQVCDGNLLVVVVCCCL